MEKITYSSLFTFLKQLGFRDSSRTEFERVFENSERDIVFAFSMLDDPSVDRHVRAADILSVEFRLQQEALISGGLAESSMRLSDL